MTRFLKNGLVKRKNKFLSKNEEPLCGRGSFHLQKTYKIKEFYL